MIRTLVTTTLGLTLFCTPLPTRAASCEDLLPRMQSAMADIRGGWQLSDEQQQDWRAWTAQCKDPEWQRQLAALGPPLPVNTRTPSPPMVNPAGDPDAPDPATKITWRDYLLAAVRGFERGATAPVSVTRCNTASRHGRTGTYCTTTTY
jgi:hypothetical protein